MFWKNRYHEDMEKRLVSKKDLINAEVFLELQSFYHVQHHWYPMRLFSDLCLQQMGLLIQF